MPITVENMLKLDNFFEFKVIAGHNGLQREITSVSVMEAPDVNDWVKGGEFFITTGYCMKDNPKAFEDLIINMNNSGVSALGIKLNRFIEELPERVVNTANRLSFPLIECPINFAFVEIINPVLSTIIDDQSKRMQHSEKIHKSFTQLVINGGDTQKIVNTLRNVIKDEVVFYDTYHEKKYFSANSEKFISDIKALGLDEMLSSYKSYQINIDKKNYGYIIISSERTKCGQTIDYDEIAIEHASTVLKLEIQKKISNMQVESRYRDEFVRDLIINNIKTLEEVNNRSKLYDWDLSTGMISVIVDIDNFKLQYLKMKDKEKNYSLEETKLLIFESSIKIMKKYFNQVIYTNYSDSIVFLLKSLCNDKSMFKKELKKICEEICVQVLNDYKFTVIIGVGNYEKSVMYVHRSFENAKRAIKLGRVIYKCNKVIFFNELGVYKLLAMIYKSEDAKEFYLSNLRKLIDYDIKNNGFLVKTLRYIVQNDWNLKAASRDMFVHYNTIKYRFNKICELIDFDLRDPEQKTNIIISLKLMEMAE